MAKLKDHASRDHALCSASSAHRWIACPASVLASSKYPPAGSAFAEEGTAAHEVAEYMAKGGNADDVLESFAPGPYDLEEMLRHAEGYRDYIQSCIESDLDSVLLETRVDFSRWVPDGFGTADCIIVGQNKLSVIDYKYGQGVAVSAVDNPQMKLYALGAYEALHELVDDLEVVEMHIYQPRKNNVSVDSVSVQELLSWADTVAKPAAEAALSGKGTYGAGEHCRFCPHAGKCRELASHCQERVRFRGKTAKVSKLAPWEVADVLSAKGEIMAWLKAVEEQARVDILNGEDVPGYKVVEGRLGNRKWTDELAVAEHLKAEGVPLEEYTELVLLSPSAMDKSLGKKRAAELLDGFIKREAGAPTLVPTSDKRPPINRLADAQEAFK